MSLSRDESNAANAQHSTGPRTPEGKARSSQNARTHGLSARDLVIVDQDLDEFHDLQASLLDDLQPQGALEHDLFDQLLHASWNLRRVRRLEALICRDNGYDLLRSDDHDQKFRRLARYHAPFQRTYFRCLRELGALQTNRALRAQLEPPAAGAEPLPLLASVAALTKRTQKSRPRSPNVEENDGQTYTPWPETPWPEPGDPPRPAA